MAHSNLKVTASKNREHRSGMRDLLFRYVPYWPFFLLFLLLCGAGAWFYLQVTPYQYDVTASIMIKDEKKGSTDGQTINQMNQISEKRIVENE